MVKILSIIVMHSIGRGDFVSLGKSLEIRDSCQNLSKTRGVVNAILAHFFKSGHDG